MISLFRFKTTDLKGQTTLPSASTTLPQSLCFLNQPSNFTLPHYTFLASFSSSIQYKAHAWDSQLRAL